MEVFRISGLYKNMILLSQSEEDKERFIGQRFQYLYDKRDHILEFEMRHKLYIEAKDHYAQTLNINLRNNLRPFIQHCERLGHIDF